MSLKLNYTFAELSSYFKKRLVSADIEPHWFNDVLVTLRRDEFEVTKLIHLDKEDLMEEIENMIAELDSHYPIPIFMP